MDSATITALTVTLIAMLFSAFFSGMEIALISSNKVRVGIDTQKGAVENANKILREYFPKGTDFRRITQAELNKVQFKINERPRKKLNFSTPKIEFFRRIC